VFSLHGYYDWRNIAIAKAITTNGDCILEIGGNVGTETVGFSDIVGDEGKVHSFEPLPSNIYFLNKLSKETIYNNITVHKIALSDTNQTCEFIIPPREMSGLGHIKHGNSREESLKVECRTLDSMADEIGFSNIIFIDTEGEEVRILRGARNYIKRSTPAIILEASEKHLNQAKSSIEKLYSEIKDIGYISYGISRLRLIAINEDNLNSYHNWLCVPETYQSNIRKIQKILFLCGVLPCIPGVNPLTQV
jgi:FkbM family methyltransferase